MKIPFYIVMLMIAPFLPGCGEETARPEPVIRPVRFEQVYATGGGRTRTFSGAARAALESKLSFKVAGTVERLAVEVGDRVKRGQLIAALDDGDYRLRVQDAEASLASANAQAINARSNYARVRALYENNNASRNDLDAARAGAVSADETVKSVGKKLELSQSQLGYARLASPVDGSIAAVRIEVNENVSPGQTVVLLTSGSQLEVEIAVPELLIVQVREGQSTTVKFDALKDREFTGHVTEVGVTSTGTATTFPVTVRLDHADPDFRPGMAAEVGISFGATGKREHIYVPLVSVGEDRNGHFAYVVVPADEGFGQVHRRALKVRTDDFMGENFEVIEGISDGDRVVTAGISRIVDGQRVRLLGDH